MGVVESAKGVYQLSFAIRICARLMGECTTDQIGRIKDNWWRSKTWENFTSGPHDGGKDVGEYFFPTSYKKIIPHFWDK